MQMLPQGRIVPYENPQATAQTYVYPTHKSRSATLKQYEVIAKNVQFKLEPNDLQATRPIRFGFQAKKLKQILRALGTVPAGSCQTIFKESPFRVISLSNEQSVAEAFRTYAIDPAMNCLVLLLETHKDYEGTEKPFLLGRTRGDHHLTVENLFKSPSSDHCPPAKPD
ncbi:hypothetical protein OF83DRAFT_1089758, partial [Amylostereum chailletii]